MKQSIALLTSCVTIVGMWAAGSGKRWSWLLGLANQIPWLIFIVLFKAWGLLPLSMALIVTYSRNWIRWGRR